MVEETLDLLKSMVQELRAVRQELSEIRADLAPFAEERKSARRMQSPLIGVDLFRGGEASSDSRS